LRQQENEKAKEKFEQAKAEKLNRITDEGRGLSQEMGKLKKTQGRNQTSLEALTTTLEKEAAGFTAQISALQAKIDANPQEPYVEPAPEEIPEYVDASNEIKELSAALQVRPETSDSSELTAKKRELQAQLDDVKQQLGLKTVIEANARRKAELLKEEKSLAQQKADLEKQEFTAESLIKEQMNEVERRVNGKFSRVRFKMFSQQLNGGEKPDCILISAETGAKFMDTNSADKINIGLDIINTLCEFNSVCAPIFVDNAEGINQLLPVNSQLVKLTVTTDKELVINQQLNS
jgi:hypothetical protein